MSSIDDDLSQVNPLRVLYPFMFTGIVNKTATILAAKDESYGKSISIECSAWENDISIGESISLSGCCLTVTSVTTQNNMLQLSFDVIPETLRLTTIEECQSKDVVNVERAVTAGTPLGGHIVQGHIDYVTTLQEINENQGEYVMTFAIPQTMHPKIVEKGCIAINGVSLTISSLDDETFSVSLIPETLKVTTLASLALGDRVNIETDVMLRSVVSVVERVLATKQQA